jgi:RNA polymerase sigma-70 factor (ECF subfamily)
MANFIDRFLIFRIRNQQDPQAFAQLYDRYVAAIYRFILLKVPAKEDAEDLTSEVFLKCWNHLQEHHDVRHVRAFLYQIARTSIADWYRAKSSMPDRSFTVTFSSEDTSTVIQDEFSDKGTSKAVIEARAELSIVMGRLERLKDDYRDVLTLRLIDNLSFKLIANVMGKTPGAVRVLYHRAKKALDQLNDE